jgi:hypothetical protein
VGILCLQIHRQNVSEDELKPSVVELDALEYEEPVYAVLRVLCSLPQLTMMVIRRDDSRRAGKDVPCK